MIQPTDAPLPPDLMAGWRFRAVIWSVVVAALGYLGFAIGSGWGEVVAAVRHVGWWGVAVALGLSLANYGLRFVRWQLYLSAMGHRIAVWPSWKIYLAGFALTTTPGKAGEALRGLLLKPLGVPYTRSLAAFLSERLSDLLAVVALTLFGLSLYPSSRPLILVGAVAVGAGLLVLSQPQWLQAIRRWLPPAGRLTGLLHRLLNVLDEARACHRPGLLLSATALSLVAWTAEAWAFDLILRWMGWDLPLAFAVFVYAIGMLAGALSFMPGGLGGAEVAMVTLLTWRGIPMPQALAATLLIRLATLWFAVALGAVFLSGYRTRPS